MPMSRYGSMKTYHQRIHYKAILCHTFKPVFSLIERLCLFYESLFVSKPAMCIRSSLSLFIEQGERMSFYFLSADISPFSLFFPPIRLTVHIPLSHRHFIKRNFTGLTAHIPKVVTAESGVGLLPPTIGKSAMLFCFSSRCMKYTSFIVYLHILRQHTNKIRYCHLFVTHYRKSNYKTIIYSVILIHIG